MRVRLTGERAIYKVHSHEFNPRNEKHWLVLVNKEGWRHVRPNNVRRVK